MVTRKFTVLLEPAEEGGFIVKCLELPVATQGETKEEALKNIKEAIEGYLEVKTTLLGRKVKGEKAEVIVEAPFCSLGVKLLKLLPKLVFELLGKKGVT
jgi:predicted RNase H-like HicB family nuclease